MRARRMDLCFELAGQLMSRLRGIADVVDEVHGFKYFDERDLLGFVDGTENPTGRDAIEAAMIGDERPGVRRWQLRHRAEVPARSRRVGRAHASRSRSRSSAARSCRDMELPDDVKPPDSHVALNTIVDENGERAADRARQHAVRAGRQRRVRHLLHRLHRRSGDHRADAAATCSSATHPARTDRILDFSTAVTGSLFFVPSLDFLDELPDAP